MLGVFAAFFFIVAAGTDDEVTVITIPEKNSQSCLWQLEAGPHTIYLLGSVHFLRPDAYPLAGPIMDAYADSQMVIFETDMNAMADPTVQGKMLQLSVYPEGQDLYQNISQTTRRDFEKKMAEIGLPAEQFVRFKPWFIAMTLEVMEFQRLGFDPNYGVDMYFFRKSQKDRKAVGFLETVDFQVNLLAGMDEANQASFLDQTLKDLEQVSELSERLIEYWQTGNAAQLYILLSKNFQGHPQILDRILIDRNKNWVTQIESLMPAEKNILVVVGAMHLVGPDSVVDLLRKKGYRLEQM